MLEISDLIGKPFKELPCWDLVKEYYRRAGVTLPEYYVLDRNHLDESYHFDTASGGYTSVDEPTEGCICVYSLNGKDLDHVGIYLGANQLLHSTVFSGVCIEKYSKYVPRLKGVYRYDSCNSNH